MASSETSRSIERRSWMPALVLALGVASLLLIIATNRIQDRWIQRDQERVRAIEEIQLSMATAHLWLEEHLTGDAVDLGEISSSLAQARQLADALIQRSGSASTGADPLPLADEALRRRAIKLQAGIYSFTEISNRRLAGFGRGEAVGIGSRLDVAYDAVFNEARSEATFLQAVLEERQVANRSRASLLYKAILAAWVSIVAIAVIGLWTRERRHARAEAALEDSRAQLLHSQKMEAVGRLAGGMAHDINNYLGAIHAQSELVKMRSEPGDDTARRMDSIMLVVNKASSLIERLLAFSRQEPITPEVVSLNRVVREGVGAMARRLVGEDVQLDVRLEPRLWNVKIDPSQIEQVIVNLVVNAREAMPHGGSIMIETANRPLDASSAVARGLDGADDYVVLSVSDTGEGIADDIRDKIFEPFFTTKGLSKSSGLGLSTVYGIVEQNGGAVDLRSRQGEGTHFEIYLPRSARPETVRETTPDPVERFVSDGKILLVEDNDELRESTSAMIEALGYRVVAAASAEEALGLFDAIGDELELIITDVVMPGLNGKELVDRIRVRRDDLKVLYVSGYTDDVIVRHGISHDEGSFLKKPFSADALVARIRELLEPVA